jgi:hypothetical protein
MFSANCVTQHPPADVRQEPGVRVTRFVLQEILSITIGKFVKKVHAISE